MRRSYEAESSDLFSPPPRFVSLPFSHETSIRTKSWDSTHWIGNDLFLEEIHIINIIL